jgi:hypothetical protein
MSDTLKARDDLFDHLDRLHQEYPDTSDNVAATRKLNAVAEAFANHLGRLDPELDGDVITVGHAVLQHVGSK